MIPLTATVGIRRKYPRTSHFRLWIPLFLIWLLLAPVALLLLPLLCIACLLANLNPFRVIADLGRVIGALKGTHVEAGDHSTQVVVDIP
jgi:hypothetical protein